MPDNAAIPYDTQTRTLAGGGGLAEIMIESRYVGLIGATFPHDIQVSFNGSRFVSLPLGMQVNAYQRGKIWIRNANAAANTVILYLGNDGVQDNRLAFDPNGTPLPVTIIGTPPFNLAQVGGVAFAQGQRILSESLSIAQASGHIFYQRPVANLDPTYSGSKATGVSAVGVNLQTLRAAPVSLQSITVSNLSVAFKFFRMYEAAAPVVGVSTPTRVIAVPPNSSVTMTNCVPEYWFNGFSIAITGAAPLLDATAIAANEVTWSVAYA